MGFLNVLLAGFVGLAAIPIIIHLLNQRRFKIVVWAAMDFLLATIESSTELGHHLGPAAALRPKPGHFAYRSGTSHSGSRTP